LESRGKVADADGAMVGGGLCVPLGEEVAGTDGEAEAAVGVADLEDGAGFDFALRDEEFEALVLALNDGEQGDGALLDAHLDGEASAHLAVEDFEGTDFRQAFGDGGMAGAVVSHKDDVVGEVDGEPEALVHQDEDDQREHGRHARRGDRGELATAPIVELLEAGGNAHGWLLSRTSTWRK